MADIKPLGSEKLQGDEKLKRILELTYYGDKSLNESTSKSNNVEYIKETETGFYSIVKEKDGYYVKKGLTESSIDYIGGLFMKNKNKFNSYNEALKRLELISGQEQLQEATKYVLKKNTPSTEAPVAEPSMDMPAEPSMPVEPEMPSEEPSLDVPSPEELPMDDEMPSEEPEMGGDEEGKRSDYMAEVQKFAGKLGQELRDQKDRMESDDIKYVLNMVISAVDLDKLDDEDIEEIGKKFDRDEDDMSSEEPEMPSDEEMPAEEPEMGSDEDLDEMDFNMDKLESFVNTPFDSNEGIDFAKYSSLSEISDEVDDVKEIDLEEIKSEINRSIEETLGKYFK